jgi:predicted N-acetyltransferase YhbS
MHGHPLVEQIDLSRIGVAELHGHIVGVVHPEHHPAFCHLQAHPETHAIKEALIEWAIAHLYGPSKTFGREVTGIWVADPDPGIEAILTARGFTPTEAREHLSVRSLAAPLPPAPLPEGYRLTSLVEDDNLEKLNRVLWRGFDHEGPPPEAEIPGRLRVQQTPHFRKDLNIVVVDTHGDFVSYAGLWIDPVNRIANLEPVATDPDHRRRGLASSAIVEGLRRVRTEGATTVWVGSDHPLYTSLGFRVMCSDTLWIKPHE